MLWTGSVIAVRSEQAKGQSSSCQVACKCKHDRYHCDASVEHLCFFVEAHF